MKRVVGGDRIYLYAPFQFAAETATGENRNDILEMQIVRQGISFLTCNRPVDLNFVTSCETTASTGAAVDLVPPSDPALPCDEDDGDGAGVPEI